MLAPWKKSYDKPRQCIKKQRHYFADKGPSSQSYCFSSSHVWMWELDHKEVWGLKNWCFWTVVLEKTFESPLDSKESNQLILEEISPEYSLEGLMLRLKLLILWPPDTKCWFIKEDPDAGKDWRQEEKGTTEDEMIGWYHRLNGHKVWASSGRWWRTRRPSVLQSMGSQRVGHDRTTEQQLLSPWAIQLWSPVCIWNSTTKTSAIAMPSWLLRNTLLEDLCRHCFCSAALSKVEFLQKPFTDPDVFCSHDVQAPSSVLLEILN